MYSGFWILDSEPDPTSSLVYLYELVMSAYGRLGKGREEKGRLGQARPAETQSETLLWAFIV